MGASNHQNGVRLPLVSFTVHGDAAGEGAFFDSLDKELRSGIDPDSAITNVRLDRRTPVASVVFTVAVKSPGAIAEAKKLLRDSLDAAVSCHPGMSAGLQPSFGHGVQGSGVDDPSVRIITLPHSS